MIETSLRWIVIIPLLGAALNGVLNGRLPRRAAGWLGSAAVGASLALSVRATLHLASLPPDERILVDMVGRWLSIGSFHLDIGFYLDPLSAVMILVVTGVGFLIHIYSLGYMAGDEGLPRFFAYFNLMIFAMLLLVLGENLVLLFVGWEGVGLCSYLLIGFWFGDKVNADAGRKAFIANRVGDAGMLLGMLLIGATLLPHVANGQGVFSFTVLQQHVELLVPVATVAALLLFMGVAGKSAQIPLFIWLPDAMAGPTPASALIHAATMATAGVYLMARLSFLYVLSPVAMAVVAGVGIATALFAATIALVQTDIKKVLAYSAISQLGFMVAACGVGAFAAGIFHLTTHAFSMALLFLGAGAVIHAMHQEQDMRAMGGLKGKLSLVFAVMLIGTIAIAGVPLLACFVAMDEILFREFLTAHGRFPWVWLVGFVTAALTAFYMMRLLVLTFFGECRAGAEVRDHLRAPPITMTLPLLILAALSVGGGWLGWPYGLGGRAWLQEWLTSAFAAGFGHGHGPDEARLTITLAAISCLVALAGLSFGYYVYARRPRIAEAAARWCGGWPHRLLERKYYVDEIFAAALYRPLERLARVVIFRLVDRWLIDGLLVNGTAMLVMVAGSALRMLQNGMIRFYAWVFVAGVAVFAIYLTLQG